MSGGAQSSKARVRRPGRRVAIAFLCLVILAAAALSGWRFVLSAPSAAQQTVEFEVMPGWGGSRIASELKDAGLIRSSLAFEALVRLSKLDRGMGEGLYDLSPNLSSRQIADRLIAGGRPRTVRIVIPEGWRASEVVARLAANGLGSEVELAALVAAPGELAPAGAPEGASLEGYLFPATYDMPVRATALEALRMLTTRFEEELSAEVVAALADAGLKVHDWVTLASIVQAEAASAAEMPIIAGVFLNRLDDAMPLQSDPTVAYGLGKPMPELDAVAGDLRRDTPWNTYTRGGLPASPIGNPGSEALASVLAPQRLTADGVPYLYFLHGTDGGVPVFRPNTSFAAHDRDVDRYLRGPLR